jgi:beta-galactosidase
MKKSTISKLLLGILVLFFSCQEKEKEGSLVASSTQKLNRDWQFYFGQLDSTKLMTEEQVDWSPIDLPHDWSILGEYSLSHNANWQSGYLPNEVGWYKKKLQWEKDWEDKNVFIHFESVYPNCVIYLNGEEIGKYHNGYLGSEYELTNKLKKGENILHVKVDHRKYNTSRWYTGSGINRDVWLKIKNKVYIETDGVYFSSQGTGNDVDNKHNYQVEVALKNSQPNPAKGKVRVQLLDKNQRTLAPLEEPFELVSNSQGKVILSGNIASIDEWSPKNPNRYLLKTEVILNNEIADASSFKVGFRDFEYVSRKGMFINGELIKIKGVGKHSTFGALGSKKYDDVLLNQLTLLKQIGCNGIRTAHNPASSSFYSLCDSLGFLVLDEFGDGWEKEKARDDYGNFFEEHWKSDLTSFIKRDRNHPSIFMWSIGNEVKRPTLETQKKLMETIHLYDTLRPITQGGRDPSLDMDGDIIPTELDIKGFNGHGEIPGVLAQHNKEFPDELILGTENPHSYSTRGVYRTSTHWRIRDFPAQWEKAAGKAGNFSFLDGKRTEIPDLAEKEVFPEEISTQYFKDDKYYPIDVDNPWKETQYYQSSYDNATPRINIRQMFQMIDSMDFVIGQFHWVGLDFMGETNAWPSRFSNYGIIDMANFPKDSYFNYKSLWSSEPMVHLLPHWTHTGKEGTKIPMVVYTNCDSATLYLNEKSLGTKEYVGEQLVWMVPFESGTIEAKAYKNGKVVATHKHTTAGKPSKIALNPVQKTKQSGKQEIAEIEIAILDENGVFCPMADMYLSFEIEGPGKLIATENGDPLDLSSYSVPKRKTFRGRAKLYIKVLDEAGEIKITAQGKDLQSGQTTVNVK